MFATIRIPIAILLVFAAVWLSYFHTLNAPMVFDDYRNIEKNTNLHIENFDFQSLYDAALKSPTPRPVAYLTFAVNYYFGGLNVTGYHVTNILVHCLNGVLVFFLAQFMVPRFLKEESSSYDDVKLGWWIPLIASLLFVLHPIQTQSVTFIVQRMASLCATFYLAGLLAFIRGRIAAESRSRLLWWMLCFFLWLLALGTKQLAVTLPMAILLCEWILFRKGDQKWLLTGVKYFGVVAVLGLVVLYVFKGADAHKLLTRGYTRRDFTLMERFWTEGRVIIHYISLVLLPLPSRLILVYDFPISQSLFVPISTLLSWGLIIGSTFWAVRSANQFPIAGFCILWFFLHLVVESTVIPLELVYEHRVYLPMFGASLLIATMIARHVEQVSMMVFASGLVCVLLGIATYSRNSTWNSAETLWLDNTKKQPTEPRGWYNLGLEYRASNEIENAEKAILKSIELEPRLQQAYGVHAAFLKRKGLLINALEVSEAGLAIPDMEIRGQSSIGDLHDIRAELLKDLGRVEEALQSLNSIIATTPASARRHFLRAECYVAIRQPEQAINDFNKALEIDSDYFLALNNLGWLLATHPDEKISDSKQAIELASRACELTNWQVRQSIVTLAVAFARAGEFEKAIQFQKMGIKLADEKARPQLRVWLQLFESRQPLILR